MSAFLILYHSYSNDDSVQDEFALTAAAISAAAPASNNASEVPVATEQSMHDEPVAEQPTYDEPDPDQKTAITDEIVESFVQDEQPLYANDDDDVPADDFTFDDHVDGAP